MSLRRRRKCACGKEQKLTEMETPSKVYKGRWWICKSCGTEDPEFELEPDDRECKKGVTLVPEVLKFIRFKTSEEFEDWQVKNEVRIISVYPLVAGNVIENVGDDNDIVISTYAKFHKTTFNDPGVFVVYAEEKLK